LDGSALELLKSVEMSMAVEEHSETTQAGADCTRAQPNLEIRFTPVYAWMTIGFGVVFFLLGFFIALLGHHRNLGFGVVICLISVPAVIGANYWRKHLHVVAQMTPGQLVLRRDGSIDWDNIAAIENKEIRSSYHGARGALGVCLHQVEKQTGAEKPVGQFFSQSETCNHGVRHHCAVE